MSDSDNLLSISQKLLKKISQRAANDNNSDTSTSESNNNMDSSPEIPSPQLTEQAFQNDSRYRKYVQLIEKNLQSFDAVNEWADIISFLGRLLKSFQAYPQFPVIPRKQLVAKRLAQCLNPGFPAGVHQKTLEVYAYILKTIGSDQLAEDLALWSTGLFPFVQYAATHVKPQLLNLFERYYIPLKGKLRPAMRGFIIALLPALEEEGSEYFDKVVLLIESVSETVELPFFYSCMWLVMIGSPSLRPPALNYLLRKLPKIIDREAVALVLGGKENVSLMVRAFASTLNDQQLLVQRGMLELLVQNFMLRSRMIPHDDLVILMRAALSIVLRKDMSLNRRLYAWLLGTEGTTQAQVLYFNTFAEKPATQAMRGMFQTQQQHPDISAEMEQQRPYKILISLMDKWELGQPIVNNIFIDSLISLKSSAKSKQQEEVMKTANMWMDMVEPYLVCMKLFELIDTCFSGTAMTNKKSSKSIGTLDSLRLVEFTLESFHFADDEIKQIHFPLILAALVKKLNFALKIPNFVELLPQVNQCIALILNILERLPELVFVNRAAPRTEDGNKENRRQFTSDTNILDYVREFYGIGQTSQQSQQQFSEADNGEQVTTNNEEAGDLSSSVNMSRSQPQHQPYQSRPEFDSLRGQALVREISDNITSFLIDFVNDYIIADNLLSGVDVGVEGKRLKHIEHHLERVFLGACTALTIVAKYAADAEFQLKRSNTLTTVLLKCCQQVQVFGIVDAGLSTLTLLVKQPRFIDPAALKQTSHIRAIMDKLWGFLSPSLQLLHMRTIELLWQLIETSLPHQIETIISNYIIHPEDDQERLDNYEKFGIVWELSDNRSEASVVFSRPMFLMLDLLRDGASPLDRRAGDLWIRCHLKSYVRLLEPFLLALLDQHILRRPAELSVGWKNQQLKKNGQNKTTQISYFVYLKAFDTDIIDYMFTTLITLITFGGLNVLKTCKNHTVDSEGKIAKIAQAALEYEANKSLTFLDLLVLIAIRFVETEPRETAKDTLCKSIRGIQLHAADLLYLIISKLDFVNMELVQQVQMAVLHKLLFCITQQHLDLQQKLLHLLHACLAITCASTTHKDKSTTGHQKKGSVDSVNSIQSAQQQQTPNQAIALIQASSDLYVKCISDALSMSSNRSMLQHWMDFVLATLPYIRHGFRNLIVPVVMCVCHQISLRCDTIEIAIHEKPNTSSCVSADRETMVLLIGLEKMLMFCLTERILNDEWFANTSQDLPIPLIPENSALVGLAQVVHGEEHPKLHEKPRDTMMFHLPIVMQILINTWYAFRRPEWDEQTMLSMGDVKVDAILHTFSYAADQTKGRLETIFEKLFKYSTVDFVEGLTEIFYMENPSALEFDQTPVQEEHFKTIALDILSSTPSSTPQHVISTLLESIRQRTPGTHQNRRRKILRQGKLTDTSILRFAEIYCGYIKNPESMALLWPIIHSFSKDYLSQANTYKIFLPSLMRFLTVALEELSKSTGYEQDKRIRKDAQELYQRCIDYCILISGKSFDQSLWMRGRSTIYDDGDDTSSIYTIESTEAYHNQLTHHSNHSVASNTTDAMTRNVSISNVSDMEKKASWKLREDLMINQVNQYLAHQVIPRLRQLIGDNDKINSLLNNMVYYVVGPSLKSKVKSSVVLDQLCEMARMPFTYKTWRKEVWEVFIDNRFFHMNGTACNKWLGIIQTAFSIEKERMTELMARITTSPSNTFFSNKDQETINRSLNLRRLSFVLFAGSKDQYALQLPIIQEKIVELLKLDHGEMVHMEIYLCLRIILMRFSQKHLMNFWPLLITELMRLFNSFVYNDFQNRPEEAQIALAGCKFLDLLCTLELDAFQIYQWIFIRDTVETVIKTKTEGPIPIMESLNEKMARITTVDAFDFSLSESSMQPSLGSLKRPMLTMHSISSIRQLSFFIEHVGLYVYQSSFTLSKPDLPFIESLLQTDLLEEDALVATTN
ncbi:Dopey, N-terminal-domain-containing protein [Parasitella parasitica]|nr:Dopey, N-terminal-domain-containing protein [Parasitella parasitica]